MDESYIVEITARMLQLSLQCSLPMLLAAVIVGVLVSIFQAVTRIQEQTLSFIPKIVATFVAVLLTASSISSLIADFIYTLVSQTHTYGPGT